MISSCHIDCLKALLGENGVLADAADWQAYEQGARHDRGRAAFVARPASTEETSAVVAYCFKNDIALIAQSGNTGLVAGSTPDGSGTQGVLSLDRLTAPFDLDRVNRTVHVGAGMRLSDLNDRLGAQSLCFPIDLGADPCIGGMVATNTGGSRFLRYGDVRRNTLGLTVVLADDEGTVVDLLIPLRKNNVGVDWKQIFIGTCGAFGIVTECVLNVEPKPCQSATALLISSAPETVPALLQRLEHAFGPHLSALEYMSSSAVRAALDHVPSLRNPFGLNRSPDFALLLEISRSSAPREAEQSIDTFLEEILGEVWESGNGLIDDAIVAPPHELWALRHALSEGVRQMGYLIGFDLSFRRGDVMPFLAHMKTHLPSRFPDITICEFGHVGDGGVHFNLVLDRNDTRLAESNFETELRDWVVAACVEQFNGSFSAEHGIGRRNQASYDLYVPTELRRLGAGLKTITSPGRLGSVVF